MTTTWKPLLPFLALLLAAVPVRAGGEHSPQAANPAFEPLKKLVGDWEAPGHDGKPMHEEISLTGGGSVLMEKMFPGTPHAMITMYHPDGKGLVATHYCAGGNQPRLRSGGFGADGKTVVFDFADATNLASPDVDHMHKVEITLVDDDHYKAVWTSAGKESGPPMTFDWTRVKPASPPAAK